MSTPPAARPNPSSSECPICGGSGWKIIEVPGKAGSATRCDCFLANRAGKLLKLAGIPSRFKACTLASFDVEFEGANRSLASARLAAGRFVEEYPAEKDGILFVGPIGTGKTHLAVGIIQELTRGKGTPCVFCDYRELLKEIQNSYGPTVEANERQILGPILDAEVLVLDDLGAVKPSDWVWNMVSYIINYRYNEQKTTIITTSFPDLPAATFDVPPEGYSQAERARSSTRNETLGDRITDRMRSRLHEMCRIIVLEGKDYRMGLRARR